MLQNGHERSLQHSNLAGQFQQGFWNGMGCMNCGQDEMAGGGQLSESGDGHRCLGYDPRASSSLG
jgi:hypothetical protein